MPAVRAQIARADPDMPLTSVRTLGAASTRWSGGSVSPPRRSARWGSRRWRSRRWACSRSPATSSAGAPTRWACGWRSARGHRRSCGLVLVESAGWCCWAPAWASSGHSAMGRLLSTMLYGVATTDVPTFVVAGVALAGTAIAACYVPARRASRVDPLITLRFRARRRLSGPPRSRLRGRRRRLDQELARVEQREAFALRVLLRLRARLRDHDPDGAPGARGGDDARAAARSARRGGGSAAACRRR